MTGNLHFQIFPKLFLGESGKISALRAKKFGNRVFRGFGLVLLKANVEYLALLALKLANIEYDENAFYHDS